jgi:hypothetical protein
MFKPIPWLGCFQVVSNRVGVTEGIMLNIAKGNAWIKKQPKDIHSEPQPFPTL